MRLLFLLVPLLVSSTVAAKSIPWSKLHGSDDLLGNERELAAVVMRKTDCYHGCKGTVAHCLAAKQHVPTAWRLANYVVFLVSKGLDKSEIDKVLALRKATVLGKVQPISLADAPHRGDRGAPVVLVEFADFRCGHCAKLSPILKKVLQQTGRQVVHYFKPYPLRPGPSVLAAQAALAAARQGKFWQMHDLLFENPDEHTPRGVEKLAKKAGLDLAKFRAAMQDKSLQKIIDRNKIEGLRLGLKGTPTLFFNGRRFQLRKDAMHLRDRIEEELELHDTPARRAAAH